MHHAPKVSWQVSRLGLHACILASFWLAGLMACGAWWLAGGQNSGLQVGVWVLVIASGIIAVRDWFATVPGALIWDGRSWAWIAMGQTAVHGQVDVCFDFQHVMLLRFAGPAAGVWWLWVVPGDHAVHWRALRRALVADRSGIAGRTPSPGGEQVVDPAAR